ncbi:MAG: efflux RND transporter periplasmic adaptor subunit, partial [Pseudomonadota bacterium]|nr:efflux RND transporter periplasmic adaptor subunit [Pseudomonadota bacterium]
ERGKRQFLVPRESVIRTGQSDRLVLALADGAFKSVEVTPGRVGDKYAEILDGLMPGDTVVTSAQFLIDSESSKSSDFQRMSAPQAQDDGGMNHEGMDHGAMNHSTMSQYAMEQDTMDHSTMNHGGGE